MIGRREARDGAGSDSARFRVLVLPHLESAYNFARWLVRDPALADDVLQDAMLRALRHVDGMRGVDARPWLMTIVRNVATDALRRRGRGVSPLVDADLELDSDAVAEIADTADDPETAFVRTETRASIDAALSKLPLSLRECVVLREIEGLSYKEIAGITGVPIGTVMSRIWRARRELIETLGQGCKP